MYLFVLLMCERQKELLAWCENYDAEQRKWNKYTEGKIHFYQLNVCDREVMSLQTLNSATFTIKAEQRLAVLRVRKETSVNH